MTDKTDEIVTQYVDNVSAVVCLLLLNVAIETRNQQTSQPASQSII